MNTQPESTDSHKETAYDTGIEVAPEPPKPFAFGQPPFSSTPGQERTICGIRRTTFFLSVALAVVIIAAAVGGGVGGFLAVQNVKNACISNNTGGTTVATTTATAASATTGSATSTTGPFVAPTTVVKLDCPGLTDNIDITLGDKTWVFTPACGIDYHGSDIGAVIVYSFHDCLQACAAHNHFSETTDKCTSVTFNADQPKAIQSDYGNCWLKRNNPEGIQVPDELTAGAQLSS